MIQARRKAVFKLEKRLGCIAGLRMSTFSDYVDILVEKTRVGGKAHPKMAEIVTNEIHLRIN